MRLKLLGAVCALAATLGGCGSGQPPTSLSSAEDRPPPALTPAVADFGAASAPDRVTRREVYGTATLDPPPLEPGEIVTREFAEKAVEASRAYPPDGVESPHSTRLASYSDSDYGSRIQDDGSAVPTMINQLVWAVVYPSSTPVKPRGPKPVELTPGTRCVFLTMIDARSGQPLVGMQKCGDAALNAPHAAR